MKSFMDEDFVLETETAKHLYEAYAKNLPIVDYHCHISPKEVCEDRRFDNLAQVWLGGKNPDGTYFGDHYKWRIMRAAGIPEEYVTGDADGAERIEKFAEALELAIGNPMYHWCNLELKRFFGINEPLTVKNARAIYEECSRKLREDPDMSVRGLIRQSKVAYVGTTDDPTDTLEWHAKFQAEEDPGFMMCPSFRPDKALNIHKAGFADYIGKLAASVGKDELASVQDVCDALVSRIEYFKKFGCRASDHGLDYIPFRESTPEEVNAIYRKGLAGEALTAEEMEKYQTVVLIALGEAYHRYDIVMEIHYACVRNINSRKFALMGPDTGYDMMGAAGQGELQKYLDALEMKDACPKTVVFSLNAADFDQIATLIAGFQSDEIPGKIQHGTAWWFNDSKSGMEAQMRALANNGLLGTFIGMLTDSRSFLSYTRHEYFRRIMCNMIGNWVENGEYPNNEESLKKIVEGICYNNAERYFGLK